MTRIKKALLLGILMAAVGIAVVTLAKTVGGFANWYSLHIFPVFPNTLGRLLSPLPFSVFEAALLTAALSVAIFSVRLIALLIVPKWRKKAARAALNGACAFFIASGFCLMMICLTCTVNYERPTYAALTNQNVTLSTQQALIDLCGLLIDDLAELSGQIDTDADGLFTAADMNIREEARTSMKALGQEKQVLAGYYPNPKPIFASKFMSKLNLTGIYSPVTMEANYNRDVPAYIVPYTICHELAHLKGFIREDEAGFIAYMACMRSKTAEFRYSGTINALQYALEACYSDAPQEEYSRLVTRLPDQVRRDITANYAYWETFRGKIANIAEQANDRYLKANAQEGGVKSYGRMIDLLISEYHLGAIPI